MSQRTHATEHASPARTQVRVAADENSAFLRGLLAVKEPEFARALAVVERELERQACACSAKRTVCRLCGRACRDNRDTRRQTRNS